MSVQRVYAGRVSREHSSTWAPLSPVPAISWEIWRVARLEAALKLAFGVGGGLAVLALCAAAAPADDAARHQDIMDNGAAAAMILLVLPHIMGWFSLARLNGGRPGFPLDLHFTRPVRMAVIVGLPLVYLTAATWAIYFVSALLLRATTGYAFPLLPIAAWMAAFTLVWVAGSWSTRSKSLPVLVMMFAVFRALVVAMERLTAVEIPGTYDWPPRLWPTVFDFPRTDYAWIALIGLASFGVTLAGVARQRRGEGWLEGGSAPRSGFRNWRVNLLRLPCPTSSATRAQLWFELKSGGLPVLTIGVGSAVMVLLLSAISGPIDAALNADPGVRCPIEECFYVRASPPLLTPIALVSVLLLGGNAFGIRRRQGRTYVTTFESTDPLGTARLTALKLSVKSACVLVALLAIAASAWTSMPLLGDAVFMQMWEVPLDSRRSAIDGVVAALTAYEQLALAVIAVAGVVVWVATLAVLGALWTRYARRATVAASLILLSGLALALLALGARNGIVSPAVLDTLLASAWWALIGSVVLTTAYAFWRGFAERVLTVSYAGGAIAMTVAFGMAWLALLNMAGVQLSGIPGTHAVSAVSPVLLPLSIGALAPWSYSRIRHM